MGRARPPRSAPSGPPSASRACPSSRAAKAAFFGNKGNKIKSLITEFHYPRFGPGQMWETMADEIIANGGEVRLNAPVTELEVRDGRDRRGRGRRRAHRARARSSPRCRCARPSAWPAPPPTGAVQAAAQGLRYRDFLTVALVIDGEDLFPDNWIYIHEPERAASAASRTSAPGARGWSRTSPRPASASSTSASRATSCGRWTTTSSSSSPSASSSSSAWPTPREGRARLRHARARRPTRCTTPTTPSASTSIRELARGHRQPAAGRPQRPAPLQQLGPLDAHRHARGGQHHRPAPTTTSGRSTPSRVVPRGARRSPSSPTRGCPTTPTMHEPLAAEVIS